jgi:hypothetical protein
LQDSLAFNHLNIKTLEQGEEFSEVEKSYLSILELNRRGGGARLGYHKNKN